MDGDGAQPACDGALLYVPTNATIRKLLRVFLGTTIPKWYRTPEKH